MAKERGAEVGLKDTTGRKAKKVENEEDEEEEQEERDSEEKLLLRLSEFSFRKASYGGLGVLPET